MRDNEFLSTVWQDITYATRLLAKSPGFTAVAVLTLALGIGANTAIFSLIDAVMLRALPVQDPQQLVVLQWRANKDPKYQGYAGYGDARRVTGAKSGGTSFSLPFLKQVENANIFDGVAAFAGGGPIALGGNGPAAMVRGQSVNGDFFRTLGIHAAIGRLLGPGDDQVSANPAVVLSYAYWRHNFGGSPAVLGKVVSLNGEPFTIVGVAEPRFTNLSFGNVYELWLPMAMTPRIRPFFARALDDPAFWTAVAAGRLKPGVTAGQAQAALDVMFRNSVLHGDKPLSAEADAPHLAVTSAQDALVGQSTEFADPLTVLMVAVGIILLIACANVAGLVLARATSRRREIAVRVALGARRSRLLRQLLTEAMLLGLMGGAAGLLLAVWGAEAIVGMVEGSRREALGFAAHLDLRVLAFTAGISLFTGIAFGLAPAWRSLRVDLTPGLKDGTNGSAPVTGAQHRWLTLGNALVVVQAMLAVVLLMGAGMLVHTLANLKSINPGFDTRNVLTFVIQPGLAGYKPPRTDNLYHQLKEEITGLPGVVSVGYSEEALLSGGLWRTTFKYLPPGGSNRVQAFSDLMNIGPDFLSTMKIPVVAGRGLGDADFEQAAAMNLAHAEEDKAKTPPPSVLSVPLPVTVNQAFARKYYPGVDPLGQMFGQEDGSDPDNPRKEPGYVIVGVVGDAKYDNLRNDINPTMYLPMAGNRAAFEIRTAGDPKSLVPAVRSLVAHHDSNLPMTSVYTQNEHIDMLLGRERLVAKLSGLFAGIALLLACIGLYGLLSFEVTRRTREIGIRIALGSQRPQLIWLVVSRGIALVLVGALCGITTGLAFGRLLTTLLYGVKPGDPLSLIASAVLLVTIALAGALVPARRASRVDPMVALRYE